MCDHINDRCSYKTCVLADESQSLWKRPTMIARQTPCPYGRAVSHGFCNQYKKLLRLMGTRLKTPENDYQKLYFVPKDPCILASDDCNGSLDSSWTTTMETTTTETTTSATTTSATTTSATTTFPTTTSATTTGTTTLARTTAP